MKKYIPKYLENIIKSNPKIKSGRKNYRDQHYRILKQINLIKNYYKRINKINF